MKNGKALLTKGLDHVVFTCADMARTVEFYNGKLGFPVLHTIEYHDPEGNLTAQHWYFGVGDPNNRNAHIAFFCFADGYQTLADNGMKALATPTNRFARPVGQLMHFNLRVDAEDLPQQAAMLSAAGIRYRHVTRYPSERSEGHLDGIEIQGMRGITTYNEFHEPEEGWLMNSLYCFDPDGIEVEFNAWSPEWDDWRNDHTPKVGLARVPA